MLNTLEKFYIYKETSISNQINDKCMVKPNVIYDINSDWHHQIAQYTCVTSFFLIHLNCKQHSRDTHTHTHTHRQVQIHLYSAKM